jgi:hypothetical protein
MSLRFTGFAVAAMTDSSFMFDDTDILFSR